MKLITACAATLAVALAFPAAAQAPARPQIETTKVDGTDNVYIFRNGNHQAMFVVTKEGVIATDPVAYGRPTGGQQYVDEIKKVTDKPIKYLIYSHHHFDHIAGGKAFKDAGASVVAHKRAKERLKVLKDPHTVMPDETVGNKKTIKLGGTTLELQYLGLNHSDSTLVMRLPKEKIVFIVDTIPVGHVPGPRHDRHLSAGDRGVHQEGDGDGLGAHDPRSSRHPAAGSAPRRMRKNVCAHAGGLRRDEDGPRRTASAGTRSRRRSSCRNTRAARLRERPAVRRAALLRAVGPRDLSVLFWFVTECGGASAPPFHYLHRSSAGPWRSERTPACRRS